MQTHISDTGKVSRHCGSSDDDSGYCGQRWCMDIGHTCTQTFQHATTRHLYTQQPSIHQTMTSGSARLLFRVRHNSLPFPVLPLFSLPSHLIFLFILSPSLELYPLNLVTGYCRAPSTGPGRQTVSGAF